MKQIGLTALLLLLFVCAREVQCQRGAVRSGANNVVYGDVKVHEGQTSGLKPLTLDVLLYTESGDLVSRQTVQSNGRYRFVNLVDGRYEIAVEVENSEVARFKVDFSSPLKGEIRQDIEFEWRDLSRAAKAGTVSAADKYNRPAKNVTTFSKASEEIDKKHSLCCVRSSKLTQETSRPGRSWGPLISFKRISLRLRKHTYRQSQSTPITRWH